MINVPLPFIFEPSNQWLGHDGPWSTFLVKVGTPPQDFQILPATNVQETWVPLPQACATYDPTDCPQLRGAGNSSKGFDIDKSSTWKEEGIYDLVSERWLGYVGNGLYGFDTVELGESRRGRMQVKHQVVAGIVEKNFYLGIFGLGPKPSNFSDFNDPQPSFMRSLADQDLIPSLSYGYTAGAKYRRNGTAGSLTLGGYDTSRFTPNDIEFTFASDDSRSLTVGLLSITATNTLNGTVTPLTAGIYSLIDSTVPHIWLPTSACDIFEEAFGLVYDNSTDLYLVDNATQTRLRDLNPTVTFTLANSLNDASTVEIELPYAAFDLQIDYPTYPRAKNYFPLRRAANDTQYTIGRTFLQEAYITVDYERQNFSVAQTFFPRSTSEPVQHIVAIEPVAPKPQSQTPSPSESHNLKPGIIAAIAVISVAFLIIIALVALGLCRRYRRTRSLNDPTHTTRNKDATTWLKARRKSNTHRWVQELDATSASNEKCAFSAREHPAWRDRRWDADGMNKLPLTYLNRQELPGTAAAQELEARLSNTQSLLTPHGGQTPWSASTLVEGEREMYEMPRYEVNSKRGSGERSRSGQLRKNMGGLIG